jgi:hypothetical protein
MDERIAIWNLLHDGEVSKLTRENTSVTIEVDIGYLRRRLTPPGDSFVLKLYGITTLSFSSWDDRAETLEQAVALGQLEILSTESKDMPVVVMTTMGELTIAFESVQIALETGQPIACADIARVSEEYWRQWKENVAKSRNKSA